MPNTFRYNELVRDYRKVFDQIESGYYYPVIFRKNEKDYKILRLSVFEPTVDDVDDFLKVSSRDFKDNTGFYLNFVRYTLSNLIITVNKKPKFVIEPRFQLVKYMLDQLNIKSRDDLGNILLNGRLQKLIGGNPRELMREGKLLGQKNKRVVAKLSKSQSEIARLESEMAFKENKMRDLGAEITRLSNELRERRLNDSLAV